MNYKKRFDPKGISEQDLLDELKLLAKNLGRVPSRKDMMNGTDITKRLYLYGRKFGGLTSACEKAGLVANKGGKYAKYTDKELLDHILELKISLNRTPTQQDVDKAGKYASGAYKRHFETYNKALKKINIKQNLRTDVSIKEIKEEIIRVSKLLGKAPTYYEFSKLSNTVSNPTVTKTMGCPSQWNETLKKCGIATINNRNISEDEFRNEIDRLSIILKRIPGYYDMVQIGKYSPGTYALRYGSYLKALESLGFDYTPSNFWHNSTMTLGPDGIMYRSKFETTVASILMEMKDLFQIKNFQYEKRICKERNWTCDFYIILKTGKDLWLEADGMGKNRPEVYDDENEKIKYYLNNAFNFYILPYNRKVRECIFSVIERENSI